MAATGISRVGKTLFTTRGDASYWQTVLHTQRVTACKLLIGTRLREGAMVVDPVTLGVTVKTGAEVVKSVSDAVGKVSDLLTKGLEIYQYKSTASDRELIRAQDRQDADRRRAEDHRHARELYVRHGEDRRAEIALTAQAAANLDAQRFLRKRYPLEEGPGSLRASVRLLRTPAGSTPPLVLFTASDDTDPFWQRLLWRTRSALHPVENVGDAHFRKTRKFMEWPHTDLIAHDLYDLVTLVVSVEVVTNKLEIKIGGYNLGGDTPLRHMTQVVSTFLPGTDYFTSARLSALEASAGDGFRRPTCSDAAAELRDLQMEWATRIAAVVVVAAVDGYHLLRRTGYREHIDQALDRLDSTMPAPTSLPLSADVLADPAFHLLQHARRLKAHGQTTLARRCAAEAVRALGDAPTASVDEAARIARAEDRLEPWHLDLLQQIRPLLSASVAETLLNPTPHPPATPRSPADVTSEGGVTPRKPKASGKQRSDEARTAVDRTSRPTARPGQVAGDPPQRGRHIRRTRDAWHGDQTPADSDQPTHGRPIRQTRDTSEEWGD